MDEHKPSAPPPLPYMPQAPQMSQPPMTGRQVYNVTTDTVTGVNIRLRDNLLQFVAIVVCVGLGILVGLMIIEDAIGGVILGGFAGLLIGLFGSGIFLMIFRAIQHARGRHD